MNKLKNIDIYLDGPTKKEIFFTKSKLIKGYTYNPSIFKNLGVKNYLSACRTISKSIYPKHVSFEVFADDRKNMIMQAEVISKINKNIYVKIPITYTNGKYTDEVIKLLIMKNIKLNITAIFNLEQVKRIFPYIKNTKTILSVFAGRIHDMGENASYEVNKISNFLKINKSKCKLLWASTRQIYDLISAKKSGCHIITMSTTIYKKKENFKKDWKKFSLETVKGFYNDAKKSKFKIK
jgi:transaldolase